MRAGQKSSIAFERIFLSVFLDSSLAMMGKTQQGGRFYDSHHDDLHGVRGGGAEPGHRPAHRLLDVIDGQER